jgi:hypothetical protein
VYTTFIDATQKRKKVEKDTRTNFVGGYSSKTIDELEIKIQDFYHYLTNNYLMIDRFTEVVETFVSFIDAVFCSHSKKEVSYTEGLFGRGRNAVLTELSDFMIIVICKYLSAKRLKELISENSIKEIKLIPKAEDIIFEILENHAKALEHRLLNYTDSDRIDIIFLVLSYVKVSRERFAQAVSIACRLIDGRGFLHDDFKSLTRLVVLQYNSNKDSVCTKAMHSLITTLCKLINSDKEVYISGCIDVLRNSCIILSNLSEDLLLEDAVVKNLIANHRFLLLVYVYRVSGKEMKESIKKVLLARLTVEKEFSFLLYQEAVLNGVLEPTAELEEKMLAELERLRGVEHPAGITTWPDNKTQAVDYCVYLFLNDKLLDKDRFSEHFKSGEDKIRFLYDMNNFDYSKFNLSWISNFNDNLKERISKNQTAYKEIKALYRSVFADEEYDDQMLNDYFEYFDRYDSKADDPAQATAPYLGAVIV